MKGKCPNAYCPNYNKIVNSAKNNGKCPSCQNALSPYNSSIGNVIGDIIDRIGLNAKVAGLIVAGLLLVLILALGGWQTYKYFSSPHDVPPKSIGTNPDSNPPPVVDSIGSDILFPTDIAKWTLDSVKIESPISGNQEYDIRNNQLFELQNLIKQKQSGVFQKQDVIRVINKLYAGEINDMVTVFKQNGEIIKQVPAQTYFTELSENVNITILMCGFVTSNNKTHIKSLRILETSKQ
ncbi:MAG TPA: hypothetical protein PK239_14120 [Chitinophagales bacterium]|nr:hypothetical protein [Chitinophagales bacterium]